MILDNSMYNEITEAAKALPGSSGIIFVFSRHVESTIMMPYSSFESK